MYQPDYLPKNCLGGERNAAGDIIILQVNDLLIVIQIEFSFYC